MRRPRLRLGSHSAPRSRQTVERRGLGTVDEIRFEGLQRTNPEVLRSLVKSPR